MIIKKTNPIIILTNIQYADEVIAISTLIIQFSDELHLKELS